MLIRTLLVAVALSVGSFVSLADEPIPPELMTRITGLVPGAEPSRVSASPIPGLYEVVFGPTIVYVSGDGRYMMQGDMVDLDTRKNLTETTRNGARRDAMDGLSEDEMVVYEPKDVKHTITVFTDVDCGYCQKLHQEMSELNDLGIKVRYLAFPRAGLKSESYKKIVSVWCADNPLQAMTDVKAGRAVPNKDCENPVAEHYALGQTIGISGTPTIVLQDGEVLPGYVPAKRLAKGLDQRKGG